MSSSFIDSRDGSPGLYIDEKKVAPVIFALSDIPGSAANTYYAYRNITNFKNCGINLVCIDVEIRNGWYKTSPFDFEAIKAEIADILEINDHSKLILRLHVNAPYWWMKDHPQELVKYKNFETIDDGEQLRLIKNDHNHHIRVSLASELWKKEAGEKLAIVCSQLSETPEGEAVVGIQVALGVNGECLQWGEDISQPMVLRFRKMLSEKYRTEEALQKAWGDSSVTFSNAEFRPENEQVYDYGIFRNPKKSQQIIDSQIALNLADSEAVVSFCKIIKENWKTPILTGAFFGGYINAALPCGGKLLVDYMFENRQYIDYFSAPFAYMKNRDANSVPVQKGLMESMRVNNAIWLTEMDRRPAGIVDFVDRGDPTRIDETLGLLRRSVLQPILAGHGFWYYDHKTYSKDTSANGCAGGIFRKKGWWDNEASLKEIKKLQAVMDDFCKRPYKPVADALILYSPLSCIYSDNPANQYCVLDSIASTGIAYDTAYITDIEKLDFERYKSVIFPDSCFMSFETRNRVVHLIREHKDIQFLFLYAPGFADTESLDVSHISEILKMNVVEIPNNTVCPYFDIVDSSVGKLEYETCISDKDKPIAPAAAASGVFSQTKENQEKTICSVFVKENIWYCTSPFPGRQLALDFIKSSKSHRYNLNGNPVMAGGNLVALYSYKGGSTSVYLKSGKKIELIAKPISTTVFDAESGEVIL